MAIEMTKPPSQLLANYHAKCQNCHAEFTAAKSDLSISFHRNQPVIQGQHCPACHRYGLYFKEKLNGSQYRKFC